MDAHVRFICELLTLLSQPHLLSLERPGSVRLRAVRLLLEERPRVEDADDAALLAAARRVRRSDQQVSGAIAVHVDAVQRQSVVATLLLDGLS